MPEQPAAKDNPLSVQPCVQNPDYPQAWWLTRHQQKVQEVQQRSGKINLVFLGDSITHAWEDLGEPVWQQYYVPRGALNLGFAGDRTENLLWRIEHGELDGLSPKLLVLLSGTNNAGHRKEAPSDTAVGIKRILEAIQLRLPDSKILLLAIFPRGATPQDPMRLLVTETNRLIKQFTDNNRVFWLDLTEKFVDQKGYLSREVMSDRLHPNAPQYKVWAEAMEPHIHHLMLTK